MSGGLSAPRIRKTSQNTQLTYELPHRIHNSTVYPIKSSNGSTVILYGHDHGVRIVWRGGQSFRPASSNTNQSRKTNGAENAVISLDSDDDESGADMYEDKPEFEEDEDEIDSAQPYPKILQTLDLNFGAAALHLATLPSSFVRTASSSPKAYQFSGEKIIFAAACADNYVRLVTLPLTPPSPESKARPEFKKHIFNTNAGNGSWGEKVTKLSGHQTPADAISLTLQLQSSARGGSAQDARSTSTEPSIIVASHSRSITGTLLLSRVPLTSNPGQIEPFQTVYLTSPAANIAFNTSNSSHRTSQLLVAEAKGSCRIYDYSLLSRTNDEQTATSSEQGTWLSSLYAGFQNRPKDTSSPFNLGRKTIIDAEWILGGRAIMVLLSDGEWLVWDIEGAGPGASQGLLGRQGIVGGSNTKPALNGFIETKGLARNGTNLKFAPMTPGTRKSAEPFGARSPLANGLGRISVSELSTTSSQDVPDESIAFWYGETFALIPSLNKYWSSHQTGSTNPFVGAGGGRIIKIDGIDLQGERCSGIAQFPMSSNVSGSIQDLLIPGEHRMMIVTGGKVSKQANFRSTGRLALSEKSSNGGGLEDIDRALALMDRDSKMELF